MCEHCQDIILKKSFYTPKDWLDCLEYIKCLVNYGDYEFVEATCDIDRVRNENGAWADDVISHTIQCKKCGQNFICYANTYRGGGSFTKS